MPGLITSIQGKQSYLVQQSCHSAALGEHLLLPQQSSTCLQANVRSRLALTLADWLRTCKWSGTIWPMPNGVGSQSSLTAICRPGGAAGSVEQGSRTGGRQESTIAHAATGVLARRGKQCAPATTWPATTQRWQLSGTGRQMGRGHQRLSLQAAALKQPGGVASVGTAGPLVWQSERSGVMDAPSVPVRPSTSGQGSPASVQEHHICWLSGTGKLMRGMAGTQTKSLWAQLRRCTGPCETSAGWAWCTDGRPHQMNALERKLAPRSHMVWLCVPATL